MSCLLHAECSVIPRLLLLLPSSNSLEFSFQICYQICAFPPTQVPLLSFVPALLCPWLLLQPRTDVISSSCPEQVPDTEFPRGRMLLLLCAPPRPSMGPTHWCSAVTDEGVVEGARIMQRSVLVLTSQLP
jgi:hypothetical protein